ncbi:MULTISPECIES: hypothetical protein [unclassified Xanthobacter]|uniref:hypothetical protein n=1 Tax=unclassified Xanthobacter TaxID=2623496 RepID=UPI001F37EFA0|nr:MULTISPECIES: hypothetical protein [unclassified Xanthobacter]
MELGTLLINASTSFTMGVKVVLILAGLWGIYIVGRGLADFYVLAAGDNRWSNRPPTFGSGAIRLVLGGGMIVFPGLLWVAANTFVDGGGGTADLFSYSMAADDAYCDKVRMAVTYLFALIGVIAWFRGGLIIHEAASGGGMMQHHGSPWMYFAGGTMTFFITDVAQILSNTLGMEIGLENVCRVIG